MKIWSKIKQGRYRMEQQNLELSGKKSKEPAKPSDFRMEDLKNQNLEKRQSDLRNVSKLLVRN